MKKNFDSSKQPLSIREEILLSLLVEMTTYAQYHVNSLHDEDMTEMAEFTQGRIDHTKKHINVASQCSSNPNILALH